MKSSLFTTIFIALLILSGCQKETKNPDVVETDETGVAILTDQQIEDIVKRSYQYVAMYNVNQKMALAEQGLSTRGYNKGLKYTNLLDHTARFIARPNNDVLYQLAMLDLRNDAIVFEKSRQSNQNMFQ